MLSITRKGTWFDNTGYAWNYFGDDSDSSIFFIVPRPQFSFDASSKPIFSLVEYQTNDGANGSGYTHLQVQLSVPANVQAAIVEDIRNKFGVPQPEINSLDYNPGTLCNLEFAGDKGETHEISVIPTLTGGNIASFLIELDKVGVETFKQAFSSETGSIPLNYQIGVNARLPQVKATVSFNSQAAYQYQRDARVDRNVWGDVTRREVTVRECLQQSQAGTIQIDPGDPAPPPEVMEEVNRWAQQTLENLVQNAVNQVLAGISHGDVDKFEMNMVSSFKETYERSQVVRWLLTPMITLPSMPALGLPFAPFMQTIDRRRFSVNINMNLDFAALDEAVDEDSIAIRSVDVTIQYPGLANNTARFTASQQSHLFVADWDEHQGGEYGIQYVVNYARAGQPPLKVTLDKLSASIFTITPDQAGVLTVVFDACNLDWVDETSGFDYVLGEFFFQDLSGNNQPITQNFKIDQSTCSYEVSSLFALPIYNPYIYTLTYRMRDGTEFSVAARESNAARIFVPDPFSESTLFVILANQDSAINYALLKIWYDPGLGEKPVTRNIRLSDPSQNFVEVPVNAVDTEQVLFHFQGTIMMNDGTLRTVPASVTSNVDITVSPNMAWFAVSVDPSLVDWEHLAQVKVEIRYDEVMVNSDGTTTSVERVAASRALTAATAAAFVTGFYLPQNKTAEYRWTALYSYTDKSAKEIGPFTSTSTILTVPPKPDDMDYNPTLFH